MPLNWKMIDLPKTIIIILYKVGQVFEINSVINKKKILSL